LCLPNASGQMHKKSLKDDSFRDLLYGN